MKGLQLIIWKYLKDHEKHKKYLAVIMTLSLVVTFAVPLSLIMPAISMTQDNESSPVVSTLSTTFDENGDTMLTNAAGKDANIVGNTVYSQAQLSAKALLIGDAEDDSLSWAEGCKTPQEIAEKAKDEYFLGIAYDFCAFIENDFTAEDADAEGRMAVGGDLSFTKEWNYQIGSGDFGYMRALKDTDNYEKISGFAHAIVGGKNIKNQYVEY